MGSGRGTGRGRVGVNRRPWVPGPLSPSFPLPCSPPPRPPLGAKASLRLVRPKRRNGGLCVGEMVVLVSEPPGRKQTRGLAVLQLRF